jgi:hypothetical protein
MDISDRSDEALLSSVTKLLGSHRELTAELVAHLAEIEERRLHLLLGFSSMFDFCQKKLGMNEGEAFRRILAARIGRRFPLVHSLLASGSVTLSALELLRPWLTQENHEELFEAVAGKTKREVQSLLAARFPRPDTPPAIRQAKIEPLSLATFRVEFTASEALRQKLELCRDLMSHANPSRDLTVVIDCAMDLLLAELERKRFGKAKLGRQALSIREEKPSGAPTTSEVKPSHITNAVRRLVYERDGRRCTYVSEGGRRCEARAFLELDHVVAKALGGSNDVENLRVLCRAHNQLLAEQAFGHEWVERCRRSRRNRDFCQKKSNGARSERTDTRAATYEKVRLALRGLGFRDAEARNAVVAVRRRHEQEEALTLERALREALLVATAA